MKGKLKKKDWDWLLLLGLGAAAYFLFIKPTSAQTPGGSVSSYFPDVTASLAKATEQANAQDNQSYAAYEQAVKKFANSPINTTQSIKAGLNVINIAAGSGIKLPRLSSTIIEPTITATGTAGGVAKLATGAIVGITTINKTGITALDKIIAKNKALSGV